MEIYEPTSFWNEKGIESECGKNQGFGGGKGRGCTLSVEMKG